jgi:hypothetical protein
MINDNTLIPLVVKSSITARSVLNNGNVRFQVFTAVTMKNGIFWDVMPCGSCRNRRLGVCVSFSYG